jgi:hypothetical protein
MTITPQKLEEAESHEAWPRFCEWYGGRITLTDDRWWNFWTCYRHGWTEGATHTRIKLDLE